MRAAVNDLQKTAQGLEVLRPEDVATTGSRDHTRTVFDALPDVFRSMDPLVARRASMETDESPESFILWIDENLPIVYKDPDDLARGFAALSKADVYLGRVRRRQYYGLWSYAGELMTAGVALAKKRPYKGWSRYAFPGWLKRMSQSKATRNLRDSLALKIGAHIHGSKREARDVYLEPIGAIAATDDDFAVALAVDLGLTADELAFLLGTRPSTKRVGQLMERAAEEAERRPKESAGIWADDEPDEAEPDDEEDPEPEPKPTGRKAKAQPAKKEVVEEDDEAKPEPKKGQKGLFEF